MDPGADGGDSNGSLRLCAQKWRSENLQRWWLVEVYLIFRETEDKEADHWIQSDRSVVKLLQLIFKGSAKQFIVVHYGSSG